MSTRLEHSRHSTQLLGAAGLAAILAICGLLIATYQKAFVDVVHVKVESDRAGLLLDEGARVRLAGVAVGEVRGTRLRPDGSVEIDVAIDEDKKDLVPADVSAAIRGTTVFGSKFVDLQLPSTSTGSSTSARAISAGDVIESSAVTTEVNDVFAHGIAVLRAVNPAELHTTLTSVATAVRGRGDELGQFFVDWNRYFGAIEPHLGALEYALQTAPDVLGTYAATAPALIDTADQFGTTSQTLVSSADKFEALLRGAVAGAGSAEQLLVDLDAPLRAFNEQWLPVTSLGARYAPEYTCLIQSLGNQVQIFDKMWGNAAEDEHYYYAKTGFLPGQAPYTLEENRPKLVTGVGPACYAEATLKHPWVPHVRFDDGTKDVYSDASSGQPVTPADNPVRLYESTARDWLGESGFGALQQGRTGGRNR
jgi:phospholipid/cholesterol/gamma-HCH transport system substrate-binding protein